MPFLTGNSPTGDTFEDGHRLLFRLFRQFATDAPIVDYANIGYVGTGNGVLGKVDSGAGAPAETWTITFTGATTFTVSGSVSGAQTGGTTGTDYTSDTPAGRISFRIEVGGTPFVASDAFTIPVLANANSGNDVWVIDRYDPFSADLECIMHGVGAGGTDEIYVGIRMFENAPSQIYNWEMRGFTGFSSPDTFENQPGTSPSVYTAFWNFDHEYWFAVNGRRVVCAAQASTTYHAAYLGLIDTFSTPNEFPYPMFIGGEEDAATAFNNTGAQFSMFCDPGDNGSQFRDGGGVWRPSDQDTITNEATTFATWPFSTDLEGRAWLQGMENFPGGGEFVLLPVNLVRRPTTTTSPLDSEVFGALDGCFAVTGFNNSVENLINIGGTDYVVLQNIFRNSRENFWALRLD